LNARSWVALAARESRGSAGRLAFFAACLSVGVAAVVAVAGLAQALDSGIQAQARQLLAADLAVSSRRPIADEVITAIDRLQGTRRTSVIELPTVVSVPVIDENADGPGPSLLCELKAVGPGYPFYGSVVTEPARSLTELLFEDQVLVGPELLIRLGAEVGEDLRIGTEVYEIAGTITSEPDRLEIGVTLGPRVLLSTAGLERSGLMGLGSRVGYRILVRLADGSTPALVEAAAEAVREAVAEPEFVNVETYTQAQPALRTALSRVERFLGMVALLSLLIGGIGVAQAVRAWLAGRLDAIAVLRALGVRPREVFFLYLAQTTFLALVGSVIGALAGAVAARAVPGFLETLLPVQVEVGWQPVAMLRGIALGVGVAVIFGLRPLFDVLRVPPVRVMRRDADPLPVGRLVAAVLFAVLVTGVMTTATLQSGSVVRGVLFGCGLIVATAVLALGAWIVVRFVGKVPRDFGGVALRHGLAALARPGSGTLGAVVALGLGVLTVLGMYLIQKSLSAQLEADLPADAPTAFLIDIQPDQWRGVQDILFDADAEAVDSVEVVIARMQSINGVPVADLVPDRGEESGDRRWVLTREQRLTSMETLPADNIIIDGALWSDPSRAEVSVEQDFARDMGVTAGDTVIFNVQGVPLELLVSSIRTVEWERFSINFFLVVEPGVLDNAPRYRIATARLAPSAELPVQDRLAAGYPNVTMLRIRELLEKIVAVLEQVGFGVRFLGAFTVLAGIAILAGAISAGAVRRGHQVALYKTLGMTRAQVASVFAVEYALIGLVAGLLGTVGGVALAFVVVHFGFEISWAWSPATYVSAATGTVVLSVFAGLAASTRALAVRPLAVLRQGNG
jgi:putative ABC transport system permease protein